MQIATQRLSSFFYILFLHHIGFLKMYMLWISIVFKFAAFFYVIIMFNLC